MVTEKIKALSIVSMVAPEKVIIENFLKNLPVKLEEQYKKLSIKVVSEIKEEKIKTMNVYSGFVEFEITFTKLEQMYNFLYDYLPISFEIQEPTKIELQSSDFTAELNAMTDALLRTASSRNNLENTLIFTLGKIHELIEFDGDNLKEEIKEIVLKYYKPGMQTTQIKPVEINRKK